MARYPIPHRALPYGPAGLHKIREDCQGNDQCSPGECCDCSVWVVQLVCLVSLSHDVADLLQQHVSRLHKLNGGFVHTVS